MRDLNVMNFAPRAAAASRLCHWLGRCVFVAPLPLPPPGEATKKNAVTKGPR